LSRQNRKSSVDLKKDFGVCQACDKFENGVCGHWGKRVRPDNRCLEHFVPAGTSAKSAERMFDTLLSGNQDTKSD